MPEGRRQGTLLAFDFGTKRIGVAVGELELEQAHPLTTIHGEANDKRFARIAALIDEWKPVRLVVGLPVSPDGAPHAMTARCRRFARQLRGRFGLPVDHAEERFSSAEAEEKLRENGYNARGAREHLDTLAAQIILQSYFEQIPQLPWKFAMPLLDLPDAEAQCVTLAGLIRPKLQTDTVLVGIHSGGVWVARRLKELLGLATEIGMVDVSFYRDDYGEKGLHPNVRPTSIRFEVEGRPLILVDDVLYTGRTTRAAINELFDYGRPASIRLAVLADRGGRELPVYAEFCAWQAEIPDAQELVLEADASGRLQWRRDNHA